MEIAEPGGAFDRIAEEPAQAGKIAAVGEQANAVTELEHQVRPRHDVGVAPPDMGDDGRLGARQFKIADVRPTTIGREANTRT
jgi:hypothetical protein